MKLLILLCCLLSLSLSALANDSALNIDIDQQIKTSKMNELKTLDQEVSVLELKAASILGLVKELHSQKEKEFYISAVVDTTLAAALIFPALISFDAALKNSGMGYKLASWLHLGWTGANTYGIYKLGQNVYLNYKEKQELAQLMEQFSQQIETLGIIQDNETAKKQLYSEFKDELASLKEQLSEDQKDGVKKKVAAGLFGAYGVLLLALEIKDPHFYGERNAMSALAVTGLAIARIVQLGDIKADFHLTQKQAQVYQRELTKVVKQLKQVKQQIRRQEAILNKF